MIKWLQWTWGLEKVENIVMILWKKKSHSKGRKMMLSGFNVWKIKEIHCGLQGKGLQEKSLTNKCTNIRIFKNVWRNRLWIFSYIWKWLITPIPPPTLTPFHIILWLSWSHLLEVSQWWSWQGWLVDYVTLVVMPHGCTYVNQETWNWNTNDTSPKN